MVRGFLVPLALLFVVACGAAAPQVAPVPAGPPAVLPAPVTPAAPELVDAWQAARGVFDRRCVVCHGCYDAPCQLIMSSFEGIERGASKEKVYEASRLRAMEPTRLFIDAQEVPAWREKGFASVLPQPGQDPAAALIARMLELKRDHPLPGTGRLKDFEIGLNREEHCPLNAEQFDEYKEEHPTWGMPYALPGLSSEEHGTLMSWLKDRAPRTAPPALSPALLENVARWENFLNQPEPKGQLAARYIFEHLFLGSLYFEDVDEHTFFRLVRSRTAPGKPLEEINTRRPFEDPKGPVYYRLVLRISTVLDKTHMPYALSDKRLARYTELFLTPRYDVTDADVRNYDPENASNPFRAFRKLPVRSRYRFMLDEAQFTLMGFIKGPVCRGQVALDVIQDRFWVTFVSPDLPFMDEEAQFLAEARDHLDLPAEGGSNGNLVNWLRYARNHDKFLAQKAAFLKRAAQKGARVSMDAIWNGDDGKNSNASLTVFRHFDSATVTRGLVGEHPKTAWVISYSVLERIHYLLVAGFDVFGNVGHQLNTRLYMDFLRMESEHNFLAMLPKARRRALVDAWYRDARDGVKDQVYGKNARFDMETTIAYRTMQPEHELYDLLAQRLAAVAPREYVFEPDEHAVRKAFEPLLAASGSVAHLFPETTFIEVRGPDGDAYYTLLRDTAYTNVAHLFGEEGRRAPKEDKLVLLPGFLGAYPNLFVSVKQDELDQMVQRAIVIKDDKTFDDLCERFCVRRTSPEFWPFSDRIHDYQLKVHPIDAGLFDYNRLEDH